MLCDKIHRTLKTDFKYAWVWGSCVKHKPGRVGKGHVLQDEDVLKRLDAANLDDTAPARPAIAPTPPADDTDDLFSMLERPNGDAVADPSSFDFDSYIKNNK